MHMQERISVSPKIIELNTESNDIFMTMDMCILSNDVNYNNAQFTDDYINGIVENKDIYIGIPFLVSREKLESRFYDNLTHEFDGEKLNTDVIGSFVDFWKDNIENALCLMGRVKIYKRFENTCNSIIELYNNNLLRTSCEVLVSNFESVENGIRKIHYNNGNNPLIGSCIVSNPAEHRAKATLLVAEAYKKDLLEGGEKMKDEEQIFNKGVKIKRHCNYETSAIKLNEIENQIYNLLNPIDPKTNKRKYNYYILEIYNDYVIVEDWYDHEILYKISYKIENDVVILDTQDKWVSGYLGFIPNGLTLDDLLAKKEELLNEISQMEKNHKEELIKVEKILQEKLDKLTKEYDDLKKLNEELNEKITKLNELIANQKNELDKKEELEKELNQKIEELMQYKEQVEQEKMQALREELSQHYAKLLPKEVFESKEAQEAIERCDKDKLNELVVNEVAKKFEINSKKQDTEIITFATKKEDFNQLSTKEYLLSEIDSE